MIGTSDGEQFNTPFEHSISASRMPVGALQQPAGALKQEGSYRGSGEHSPNVELNPELQKVLSQPHVAGAIANPKIDRSHDVPYEAGASAKPDDFTTHIDKHIPTQVSVSGKTFDPAIPANIHEQVEREVMQNLIKKGMTNEKAYEIAHHEYAEPAEDAWYKHNGIDVAEVNKWWAKQDKITEKETSKDSNFPPDLYKKPYPHNEVEGVKHEPSGVAAEWVASSRFNPKPLGKPGLKFTPEEWEMHRPRDPMEPVPNESWDDKQLRDYLFGDKKVDEGDARDYSKTPKRDTAPIEIHPDRYLEDKGINIPPGAFGGTYQGDPSLSRAPLFNPPQRNEQGV